MAATNQLLKPTEIVMTGRRQMLKNNILPFHGIIDPKGIICSGEVVKISFDFVNQMNV